MADERRDAGAPSTGRNRTLLIGAGIVAVVAAVVLVLVLRDDTDPTADGTTTTELTADGQGGADDGEAPVAPTSPPGDPDADPAPLAVDLTPVEGETEAQLCQAIVVRIGEYRDAVAGELPSPELIDALEEFELQVDSQADDQDWGDRILEQMVNARRELVTAVAAAGVDDSETAARRQAAGVDRLDRAIDEADCPTG